MAHLKGQDGRASKTIHVIQGEHRISRDPDVVLATILGSCVAACIRDPVAGIGGMNHFLLPGGDGAEASDAERFGAKLFGGAKTIAGRADIGSLNADFASRFLEREQITVVGECLRGPMGRRVQYWPVSGRARRSFLDYSHETPAMPPPALPVSSGSLELF